MKPLPVIAGFWHGSDLSFLEQVVIQSYLDHGHQFDLYVSGAIAGVPKGAQVISASEIISDPPFDLADNDRRRVAVFSDIFRFELLARRDVIWVDLDAYCVAPFRLPDGPVFAPNDKGRALCGVFRLPMTSPALAQLRTFVKSTCPIQPWRGARFAARKKALRQSGKTWTIADLPWGCGGPKAVDWFLRQTGEISAAMPSESFYPVLRDGVSKILTSGVPVSEIEKPGTLSVHFFGFLKREIRLRCAGLPSKGSYLEMICHRHGIDPTKSPVPALHWM